jgi:hypothetical protein
MRECLRADGADLEARDVAAEALVALETRLRAVPSQEDRARVLASMPDVALLAREAQLLGVNFPAISDPGSPRLDLKTGTNKIRGES